MSTVKARTITASASTALTNSKIPIESLLDACRNCSHNDDPEDVDEEESGYPRGFDVDLDSEMLGSVNPYGRQILISTGKSDWEREVTDDVNSIPGRIKVEYSNLTEEEPRSKDGKGKGEAIPEDSSLIYKGLYPSISSPKKGETDEEKKFSTRLSILTSSFFAPHSSNPDSEAGEESIIVLPDYKIIHRVRNNASSIKSFISTHLDPSITNRSGASLTTDSTLITRSYPLPYRALILICSHKRRDKRCHIAAPLLINQFKHHLESFDLEIDETGDELGMGEKDSPIEEWDLEGREEKMREELMRIKLNEGRVGVFKCSHIGGHRYAGNVIIYLPNGVSIWYGRVTPLDVGAIVKTTLIEGKVIPELLRGGLGLKDQAGKEGVLEW